MPLICLRDNAAVICIFVFVTRCEGASVGGVPRGVQNRVRKRQKGLFAANQRRRLRNDWSLVAATVLVLPPIAPWVLVRWRAVQFSSGGRNTGQWLVADLSVMDIHFQLRMALVTGILLVWFLFVWATRQVC
jgi:hypothetical protein